jgi:hypothetical protein
MEEALDLPSDRILNEYMYCPYRCVILKFSTCILSNTTRQILIRAHYIGGMFRLTL